MGGLFSQTLMPQKGMTIKQLSQQINALSNRLDEFIVFTMEHVAMKEDLKGFATKEDLFSTKEDLRREMNIQKLDIIDRMDDKFADLRGDLIAQRKTSDKKWNLLIQVLQKRKGISKQEAYRLLPSGTAR